MKKLLLTLALLFAHIAIAADDCKSDDKNFRCVKYINSYDGDTINILIPNMPPIFGKISVRVRGIDTAELSTKDKCEKDAARIAKNLSESLLKNAKRIDLENVGRDKYFRLLADVKFDGKSLSEVMLRQHLAYEYLGKKKKQINWCEYTKQDRNAASVGGK